MSHVSLNGHTRRLRLAFAWTQPSDSLSLRARRPAIAPPRWRTPMRAAAPPRMWRRRRATRPSWRCSWLRAALVAPPPRLGTCRTAWAARRSGLRRAGAMPHVARRWSRPALTRCAGRSPALARCGRPRGGRPARTRRSACFQRSSARANSAPSGAPHQGVGGGPARVHREGATSDRSAPPRIRPSSPAPRIGPGSTSERPLIGPRIDLAFICTPARLDLGSALD